MLYILRAAAPAEVRDFYGPEIVAGSRHQLALHLAFGADEEKAAAGIKLIQFFGNGERRVYMPRGSAGSQDETHQYLLYTPMNEMIAKRSEMPVKSRKSSFSFHLRPVQPPISRWWWKGAILKTRLPWLSL